MKIIQVTDTHLVPATQRLYGLDPFGRLRRVFATINDDHADADLCVLTGDLADRGETEAYGLLRELLQELRVPWRLVIGNHDSRRNFVAVFPELPRDPGGFVQSVDDIGDVRCLFLDSAVEGYGHGALDCGRLDWVKQQLAGAGTRTVLAFIHHPLDAVGLRHFAPNGMVDPARAVAAFADCPNPKHVFCGHLHVSAGGHWRGVPFSSSRGTAHSIPPHLTRPDADFVEAPPAFDVALIADGSTVIHRFEVDTGRPVIAVSPAETFGEKAAS